jgi:chromosome segregation ATPase
MKKSLVVTITLCIAVVISSLCAYAEDTDGMISALQQKAEAIQSQMKEAQQQCGAGLTNQMKSLNVSVEALVAQRVQLGQQITQLEGQIEDLKRNAVASCGRQMKQYEDQLGNIKQDIAGLQARKHTEAVQKGDAAPKAEIADPSVPGHPGTAVQRRAR